MVIEVVEVADSGKPAVWVTLIPTSAQVRVEEVKRLIKRLELSGDLK